MRSRRSNLQPHGGIRGAVARTTRRLLAAVLALVWLASAGVAAQGKGGLQGKVEDETSAAITRARVSLIEVTSGTTRDTRSDGAGRFAFEDVSPGEYVLHVTAAEFQAVDYPVTVGREAPKPVTITLQIGLTEEVTVTGSRSDSRVNPTQNADAIVISRDFLSLLPTEGGDVLPLISSLIAPAASGANGPSIVIDGVEGDALDLDASAIRHLVLNRNPYSSEFRRPGKGRVEIVTEHGSRKFHGSGTFAGRNALFDARNAFAQAKPDEAKRFLDGSWGGPVRGSSRTLFFLNGTWLNHDESAIVHARTLAPGFVTENVAAPSSHAAGYGRLDFRQNERHSYTGRYDFISDAALNRGVGGLHLTEQAYDTDEGRHRLQLTTHGVFAPLINDLRVGAEAHRKRTGQLADRPAIVVHGAFSGGAAQTYHVNDQTELEVQDTGTAFRGIHTIRFGGETRFKRVAAVEGANFGGTFEFAGLTQFALGSPILFRVTQGNPRITFSQRAAFGFIQDDMRLRKDLSLMLGLRDDWQARPGPGASLAPRGAITWAPGAQKTVLRAGAGTFTDRLSDTAIVRSSMFDGQRLRDLVIMAPAYPDAFGPAGEIVRPNLVRLDPGLRTPQLLQASVEVERELWNGARVTIDYTALRGWQLFRSRDLNRPVDRSGARSDPAFLNIAQVESTGTMRSDALTVSFNGRLARRFTGVVHYTASRAIDDSSGVFDLPADSGNPAAERGRADHDRRHRLNAVGSWDAGFGVRVGLVATLASGAPFDITTGFDDNGDGIVRDRPAGVTRNLGQGPGQSQIDLRITKAVPLRPSSNRPDKHGNVVITFDAFNAFNRTNFANVVGVQNSPLFGLPTSAKQARTIQVTARYKF